MRISDFKYKGMSMLLKRLFLIGFVFLCSFQSFSQLSELHYLPPLKQASGAFTSQKIYLSTPETTAFDVNVYKGTSSTIFATLSNVSNANPITYTLANGGDNDITLLTAANCGSVQSNSGLRFESTTGQKFYVNWRGSSLNQASTLTSKGRVALGTAFKWGGIPNKGTNYSILNASLGIMASEDNTTVTIFGYHPNCTFRDATVPNGITNDLITINLNKGQTHVLEATLSSANDINIDGWLGASISSTKNIAVNIGEMHFQPTLINNQDCGIDQIIPENTLGKQYIFVRGNGVDAVEFPVVIATQNGTNIYVNGGTTPIATVQVINTEVSENQILQNFKQAKQDLDIFDKTRFSSAIEYIN